MLGVPVTGISNMLCYLVSCIMSFLIYVLFDFCFGMISFFTTYIFGMMMVKEALLGFLMGLFGFFFSQIMGIVFLYLVFEQIPSLQGWTLDQLIFIYGFAQIPRGIDHLFTDNIWMVAWRLVINGDFDRYMLRPMNIFF